jgi:molybdenum cofactor cytidylyltransferase
MPNGSTPMNEKQRGSVAAVILGAGTGSRFREADAAPASKLVVSLDGAPLVRHVAKAALASQARPVVVVTGHAEAAVRAALADLDVSFAFNPDYATGLASSLKVGLADIPQEAAGALILLGDMPRVTSETLDRLIELFEAHRGCAAVVPTYAGLRGNPALLSRRLFPQIARLHGDQGARGLLEKVGAEVVEFDADVSVALDVDTPEELSKAEFGARARPQRP